MTLGLKDARGMMASREHSEFPSHASKAGTFIFVDLVAIIGYKLTAYIGGASTFQSAVDWLRNGLPRELEPRMRSTFDVVEPIAAAESEVIAQGFLLRPLEETSSYGSPARMLREADVEIALAVLMQAAARFLSNEAPDLDNVACRLQELIGRVELPKGAAYTWHLWQGRLSLTLIHGGFREETLRKWDTGTAWPCWDKIIAKVPEMARARTEIDLTTGFPFRYLRARRLRATKDEPNEKSR
jgi:hypothetical protein